MADKVYQFEGLTLDGGHRTLTDNSGRAVALAPRVFDTLLYLVENAGELVDKTTLMEAIWPDVTVEENSLSQNISTLRRALGDTPGENRFIVTAPGRGYRFVANVSDGASAAPATAAPATPAQQQGSRSGQSLVTPGALASPNLTKQFRASVAVMPFANLTGEPSKEYFSDGMADEIINLLAKNPGLKTPSRMSTFAYKGQNVDARQVAEELGVDAVLEGTVRAAGDRVRVAVRLVDGKTGFQIWANTYDREMADIFALQDELAYEIIDALFVSLNTSLFRVVRHNPRPKNLEAYKLCLLAEWMANQQSVNSLLAAREIFQQSIALDPDYARPVAGWAHTGVLMTVHLRPEKEVFDGAEAAAKRALELHPDNETALATLGQICAFRGDFVEAAKRMRAAMAIKNDPLLFNSFSAVVPSSAGQLQESLRVITSSIANTGLVRFSPVALALAYAMVEMEEVAQSYIDKALEIGVPATLAPLSEIISLLYLRRGEIEKSLQLMLQALPPGVTEPAFVEAVRVFHRALAEDMKAEDAIAVMMRVMDTYVVEESLNVKRMLLWLTMLGGIDEAYKVMDAALDAAAKSGTVGSAWGVLWLKEMKPFRDHPNFMDVAKRIGLTDYWREYGPPDGYEFVNGRLFEIPAAAR